MSVKDEQLQELLERLATARKENENEFHRGMQTALAEVAASVNCDIRRLYKGQLWADKIIAIMDKNDDLKQSNIRLREELDATSKKLAEMEKESQTYIDYRNAAVQSRNDLEADRDLLRQQLAAADEDAKTCRKEYDTLFRNCGAQGDRLAGQLELLRAALQPFAAFGRYMADHPRSGLGDVLYQWDAQDIASIRRSDLKRADEALAVTSPEVKK